jgi:hypothetical protein
MIVSRKVLIIETAIFALISLLEAYKFSLKTAAFVHSYKPFAVCIAQHFPLALVGPTICRSPRRTDSKKQK